MGTFNALTGYGERLIGLPFPPDDMSPAGLDLMDFQPSPKMSTEQRRFVLTTVLTSVRHPLESVKVASSLIAGSDYPVRATVVTEIGKDCDTSTYIDNELGWRRRKWREDLIHMNGLRQALQQGEATK